MSALEIILKEGATVQARGVRFFVDVEGHRVEFALHVERNGEVVAEESGEFWHLDRFVSITHVRTGLRVDTVHVPGRRSACRYAKRLLSPRGLWPEQIASIIDAELAPGSVVEAAAFHSARKADQSRAADCRRELSGLDRHWRESLENEVLQECKRQVPDAQAAAIDDTRHEDPPPDGTMGWADALYDVLSYPKALNEPGIDEPTVRAKLIEVAATVFCWLESIDRRARRPAGGAS